MDAPAMLTSKHVPEDVGLRNTGEDDGAGQQQLHRDDKQHKPVLKKVKDKVKKIKDTLAGHGHGNGHGGERDDGRVGSGGNSSGNTSSSEEGEEDVLEREAAMEKGGYMDDVEDKPLAMETDSEVHGAPMYDSARTPAVHDLVAKYEPARIPAAQDVEGDGAAARVRLGDLGGPVVEDPAAPRSTTPAAREGEDIGTTPVTKAFEKMTVSDDPAHVGAGKTGARPEEWKDAAAEMTGASGGGASYTDRLKNAAAGTTEYGKKLASTVYEKVAGVGGAAAVATVKRDDEHVDAMPVSDTVEEEFKDAPAATDAMDSGASSAPGYTDKIKSAAAGTTGYGKQLASTVYEKVAGVGTAVGPNLRPQVGAVERDHARDEAMPLSAAGGEHKRNDTTAATDASADSAASGATYTDKVKSAAAGTTGYGKQLASTVYEKVTGVGTAVAGKVQGATQSAGTATPGVGAQPQDATAATNSGAGAGQDKGVTVTGYIADMLRPGDEDRALSETISGAVQRRKEEAPGSTVAQRVPAPSQVITKAREAVSSLTGGDRVSEAGAVQPTTAGTAHDAKEGVAVAAVEEPALHAEEIHGARLNTNTM